VEVQNQSTLDGSPVAQAIIKFMEDREEYSGVPADLHRKLEGVAESLGVSVARDRAWPKSARYPDNTEIRCGSFADGRSLR
jgi:hypothetical protein